MVLNMAGECSGTRRDSRQVGGKFLEQDNVVYYCLVLWWVELIQKVT